MSTTKHTPAPWRAVKAPHCASEFISHVIVNGDVSGHIAAVHIVVAEDDEETLEADANSRLIAASPDHALICWAMCVGAGRWEPLGNGVTGEFCINGLRYATDLDEFGCPEMTPQIREAINRAKGGAS